MSFSNTLNRLREAAKGQRGRNGDVLVSAFDLRDLLNDYDRIDTKYRALNEHREPDYKAQKLIADAIEQMAKEFLEGWPDHKGKYDFMIGYAYRIRNAKAIASTDNGEKNV